jgi:hypothetical protein
VIAEILADGNLHAFPISDPPEALVRRISWELGGDSTLQQAWRRFGALDLAANSQQKFFRRMQGLILALTVVVTFGAAVSDHCRISGRNFDCKSGLHYLVIVFPIICRFSSPGPTVSIMEIAGS